MKLGRSGLSLIPTAAGLHGRVGMATLLTLVQLLMTLFLLLFFNHTAFGANGGKRGTSDKCGYKVSKHPHFCNNKDPIHTKHTGTALYLCY